MATLTITQSHDFRGETLSNIDAITFAGADFARIVFSSTQFGPGKISPNVLITGDAHRNFVEVYIDPSTPNFNALGWLFAAWVDPTYTSVDEVVLRGSSSNETITGTYRSDAIIGNEGDDTIFAVAGNDLLFGGAGVDTLYGGGGDDTYRLEDINAVIPVIEPGSRAAPAVPGIPLFMTRDFVIEEAGSGYDTVFVQRLGEFGAYVLTDHVERGFIVNGTGTFFLVGNSEHNRLDGNDADNTLSGLTGNDTLYGNQGNDTLNGGANTDTMVGGTGDDYYFANMATDVIIETVGQGNDTLAVSASYNLAAGVEIERINTTSGGGTSAIDITGNAFAQTIVGNNGDNVLSDGGAGGADTLQGLAGNDTYIVNNVGTIIVEIAGKGTADRVASSVDFALAADDDIELLTTTSTGATSPIKLTGNALTQMIVGNAGANTLHTGTGAADTMRGLGGNDTYRVFNSNDIVIEGANEGTADTVVAAVDYALGAGVHVETLQTNGSGGTSGIDLTGNEIAQTVRGNAGANRLDSKLGNDTMIGGSGADTFVFSTALGSTNIDRITDYTVAADQFELDQSIFAAIVQAPGTMLSGYFKANTTGTATDANDRILYDTDDGLLYYDADGNGAGARVRFAQLDGAPLLTFSEFAVI